MRKLFSMLLVSVAFYSCEADAPAGNISVTKSFGSVQCDGGGLSLDELKKKLTDAGISVLSASCGNDGRIYPAVCGAPDGRIGIFEVPADQVKKASELGFAPLSGLPDAQKVPCK